jgi:hypothetical protein
VVAPVFFSYFSFHVHARIPSTASHRLYSPVAPPYVPVSLCLLLSHLHHPVAGDSGGVWPPALLWGFPTGTASHFCMTSCMSSIAWPWSGVLSDVSGPVTLVYIRFVRPVTGVA